MGTVRSLPSDGLFSNRRASLPGSRATRVDEPPPSRLIALYEPAFFIIRPSSVRVTPALSACRPSTVSTCIVLPSRENPTAVRGAAVLLPSPSWLCAAPSTTSSSRPPTAVRGTGPLSVRGR